jgi:hypothetical protein
LDRRGWRDARAPADISLADRVIRIDHDNRNRCGRRLRSGDVQVVGCHDDFDLEANEVSGEFLPAGAQLHLLNDDVLAFDPTEPTQALLARFDVLRGQSPHNSNPSNSPGLLRLGGERRGEEAAAQGAKKRSTMHGREPTRDGGAPSVRLPRQSGKVGILPTAHAPLAVMTTSAYPAPGLDLALTRRTTCDDWLWPWALSCC